MKINYEDMRKFIAMYDRGEFKHQRFGQAFCNHFVPIFSSSDELFYEKSRKKAMDFIYKEYVTVCEPTE